MARKLTDHVTYDQALTAMIIWETILENPETYKEAEAYREAEWGL